jgi:succinyl-diaminopimelate desuccinylase
VTAAGDERQTAVRFLGQLIAARSTNPPGDERAAARVVREQIAALGLPVPVVQARVPERPNLIFRLGSGSPHLLLNAHLDTMPPGDLSAWKSDPFVLSQRDGRFYGLGVADMKASVVALLLAAARVARNPELTGSLTIVLSADEENGSAFGMEWLASEGLLSADGAVVVEPSSIGATSWEHMFVAQRGSCVSWLVAHGRPGHSGARVHAQERASSSFARGLTALLEADLFAGLQHPVDGTPPTVNIATMVEGGMVPFAHPESLRAAIDVRTIDGMTEQGVRDELRAAVAAAGLADRITIEPGQPPTNWVPGGQTMRDAALLQAAHEAWRTVLGTDPPLAVLPACTDSAHLDGVGIPALPAYGPGTLAVAHQPNESLPVEDMFRAIDLFEALIRSYQGRSV